jgi:hypothetical protein
VTGVMSGRRSSSSRSSCSETPTCPGDHPRRRAPGDGLAGVADPMLDWMTPQLAQQVVNADWLAKHHKVDKEHKAVKRHDVLKKPASIT